MPQDQYKSKANKLNALNQNRQQQPLPTEPTGQGEPEVSDSDSNEDIFAVSRAKKVKQPPTTKLKINGVKVEFLIDTGASVNILTQKDYEFLCTDSKEQISLRMTKPRIYAFDSSEPVELKGKFEVLVDSKRRVAAAAFYVTKGTQGTTYKVYIRLQDALLRLEVRLLPIFSQHSSLIKKQGSFNLFF